jgi:hypothetical protein
MNSPVSETVPEQRSNADLSLQAAAMLHSVMLANRRSLLG